MNNNAYIFKIKISKLNMQETIDAIISLINKDNDKVSSIYTINSEILYNARKKEDLINILNSSSINTADGIGVVKASQVHELGIKEKVAGIELMQNLLRHCAKNDKKIFIYGAKEENLCLAIKNINNEHNNIVTGYINGYEKDNQVIIDKINKSNPDIVFVGLGFPVQEKWIYDNKDKLNTKVVMAVGGSIDVLSGSVKRAPKIFINLHLEWLYRIIKDPKRIKRAFALPKFAKIVYTSKYRGEIEKKIDK